MLEDIGGGQPPAECDEWARRGECVSNPGFMLKECAAACAAPPPQPDGNGDIRAVEPVGGRLMVATDDAVIRAAP